MTRRSRAILAAMLALAAVGLPGPGVARDRDGDEECAREHGRIRLPEGWVSARLSFSGIGARGQVTEGAHFPGGTLRSLRIEVEWREIEDGHQQRLELFSPDGALYQRFTTSFTGNGRRTAVDTALPVAGTSITDAGLYGEWCAEVFLDDDDAPIARRPFRLTSPH